MHLKLILFAIRLQKSFRKRRSEQRTPTNKPSHYTGLATLCSKALVSSIRIALATLCKGYNFFLKLIKSTEIFSKVAKIVFF